MHGLPKGKRKVFKKENVIQQVILASIIAACVAYSWILDLKLLKVLSVLAIAIVGTMLITYYIIEFFSGAGYSVASAFNELIYLVLGLPILVIAAGFLPVSILVAFFEPDSQTVMIIIFVLLGVLEILAILFLINRYLKDRKMNIFQYIKYVFDFEARRNEAKRFRERTDQIDGFYDDLYKVEDKIAKRMEEKSTGFDQFDWKDKVKHLTGKSAEQGISSVKCWNCDARNELDAHFCTNCSAPLKKDD
jgi:hypothetical protein